MNADKIIKLNLYIDESGTDQQAPGLVVAVVVIADNIQEILHRLEEIERLSGKRKRKWNKAGRIEKEEYIRLLKKEPLLKGSIYYEAHTKGSRAKQSTYNTTSRAIKSYTLTNNINLYSAIITIDGLSRNERLSAGNELRQRGVVLRKLIRGTRDESSSLLRLTDAIAGLAREQLENPEEVRMPRMVTAL